MNKRTLFLVRGTSGKGKTELAISLVGKQWVISADDYPGIYKNGIYQPQHQKESHQWCYDQTKQLMLERSKHSVAVANTFTKLAYIKPYIELAQRLGWVYQIIKCEALRDPDGNDFKSIHNVPPEVLQYQLDTFEEMYQPPRLGMTHNDLARSMAELQRNPVQPDAIILDMDGTIKAPMSDNLFPKSPDDFVLNNELIEFLSETPATIYICTNQRGVETGRKDLKFLDEEIRLLREALIPCGIKVRLYLAALHKNSPKVMIWQQTAKRLHKIEEKLSSRADKPGYGMIDLVAEIEQSYKPLGGRPRIWYIGDGHTDDNFADFQAVQNYWHYIASKPIASKFVLPERSIAYLPVEHIRLFEHILKP